MDKTTDETHGLSHGQDHDAVPEFERNVRALPTDESTGHCSYPGVPSQIVSTLRFGSEGSERQPRFRR
jgi:hypothetical protein